MSHPHQGIRLSVRPSSQRCSSLESTLNSMQSVIVFRLEQIMPFRPIAQGGLVTLTS